MTQGVYDLEWDLLAWTDDPCENQLPEYGYCSCYDTNIPCEPLTTIPNEALTSTQTTGCSWPVRMARGEGWSPWERSKLTLVLTYAYNRRNLNKDSSRIWNSNPPSMKKKNVINANFHWIKMITLELQFSKYISFKELRTDDPLSSQPSCQPIARIPYIYTKN